MSSEIEKFSAAEYEALRGEIIQYISAIHRTDELCLVSWGATLAWLAAADDIPQISFLLPILLAALLLYRRDCLEKRLNMFHKYIMYVHEPSNSDFGWESYLEKKGFIKFDPVTDWARKYYGGMMILGVFAMWVLGSS